MASGGKLRNLNDLAKQANVTAATVSLALRNSPLLSAEVGEKIRNLAAEQGFSPRSYTRRPKAKAVKQYALPGPILVLYHSYSKEDPVHDGLMPTIYRRLNEHGIEYHEMCHDDVREHPELLSRYRGVLYYNNELGEKPFSIPAVQIFGWNPMGPQQDRITANDEQVARLAADFFRPAGVKRALIVWRENVVDIPDHPRIVGFQRHMEASGIPVRPLIWKSHKNCDFLSRLSDYLESGDPNVALFAFNAASGLKLCCALESLGLLEKYSERNLLICDNSLLLKSFWPVPRMIDLDLPAMASRAVEMLIWRLANPGIPSTIVLQSPKLLIPQDSGHEIGNSQNHQ